MSRWLWTPVFVLFAGCNELPKRILTGAPLRATSSSSGAKDAGAPKVAWTSPTGSDFAVKEVAVIFDRPMAKAFTRLEVAPARAGEIQWLGDHTLIWTPKVPLRPGQYVAHVPAGARSADGAPLAAEHRWRFVVADPPPKSAKRRRRRRLHLYSYVSGWKPLRPGRWLVLRANGPLDLERVRKHARFVLPSGEKVAVEARYRYRGRRNYVLLRPKVSFEVGLGKMISLEVQPGLSTDDGRGPLSSVYLTRFHTQRRLRLRWTTCPSSQSREVVLRFNDRVKPRLVAARIKVTPALKLRARMSKIDQVVRLSGNFVAGIQYKIEVPAGFAGVEAAPTADAQGRTCEVRLPQPVVRFGADGTLLERRAPKQIPVWTTRVPRLRVRLRRFSIAQAPAILGNPSKAAELPVLHEKTLKAHPTRRVRVVVDPAPALKSGQGMIAVEVEGLDARGRALEGTRRYRLLNVTDLGVTTKQSATATLVWVTRLSSGAPVAGATVVLHDRKGKALGTGVTDSDGVVTIAAAVKSRWRGGWVFVRSGGDRAWHGTAENQWMFMPSGFDVPQWSSLDSWTPGKKPILRGLLFTERGIYRPGERVRFKAILRKETDGLETPAGLKASLRIVDSRGDLVHAGQVDLSEFGTFSSELVLSRGAKLGRYKARVTITAPAFRGSVERSFRVEEFKTPDFKVTVDAKRKHWFPGERPTATVSGKYLFGTPMGGAPVAWTVTAQKSWFKPPKHPRYRWRPGVSWWQEHHADAETRVVEQDEGYLDDAGHKQVVVKKPEANRIYSFEAKVTGLDRTEIAGRAQVVVHPASFYLGVRAEWDFLETTETFRADLVAVRPDGSRVAGADIDAVIYQGHWESVRQLHRGGTASFSAKAAPKVVGRCRVRSGAQPARCEYRPKEGGSYVLWAKSTDSDGRTVQTAMQFYVIGRSAISWAASDSVKMTLRADRHTYKLGQTARILVQSPIPEGEALITIERDRVLKRFRRKLYGPAPALRIPVTEDFMPNVFVSVVMVRGRAKGPFARTGDDPRRPMMRLGHTILRVSAESRRLQVKVRPEKPEYRPADEVAVRIQASRPDGKPAAAELTVWAVDEGVLSLVAYKTPDPVKSFAGYRGLGIMTSDNRYRYFRRRSLTEKGEKTGGGGGEAPSEGITRKVFKAVAFFDPSVRTDSNGMATVRFKLPENLTTFRVMAVATTTGQRFGNGEAKIVSTKRLLLKPSLPRFVRAGDRFEAGVVLHNRTGEAGVAWVSAKVRGLALDGESRRRVEIPSGSGKEVRFSFRATQPGEARLRFTAAMGTHKDGLELARKVHLPTVLQSIGLSGEVKGVAQRHVVGPTTGARRDAGGIEVVVSGSRLTGLVGGLSYLMRYPYGCAEQTTSKLLPLLGLRDLVEATGEGLGKDVGSLIRAGLSRLATFQQSSGGFGLWPGAGSPSPWVSSYVMFAMATARAQGFRIDPQLVKGATRYLHSVVRRGGKGASLTTRAWALYALATLGERDLAAASVLFEGRAGLRLDARAVLASALLKMGARERAALLLEEMAGLASVQDGRVSFPVEKARMWGFGSPVRTMALILDALVRWKGDHPLVGPLAKSILASRRNGRWRTTQESAYALLALTAAERSENRDGPREATLFVEGRKRLTVRFGPGRKPFQRIWIPMAKLSPGGTDLVLAAKGGTVRYFARLLYAPLRAPKSGEDRGLAVWRTYERAGAGDGARPGSVGQSAKQVRVGDLVRVTVHVAVPRELDHVVVDDPIPAGLQAVNSALATTARRPVASTGRRVFTHEELRADRVVLYAPRLRAGVYHRSYLARAVTLGSFAAPAVRAEGMYAPERAGSTAAGRLVVVPRKGT